MRVAALADCSCQAVRRVRAVRRLRSCPGKLCRAGMVGILDMASSAERGGRKMLRSARYKVRHDAL
eukprot:1150762-Pelagomonas_calceolata.AAC.5